MIQYLRGHSTSGKPNKLRGHWKLVDHRSFISQCLNH